MSDKLQIAKTIFLQLGGSKFTAMTGAKNLMGGDNYLAFQLPSRFAKDGINRIKITLDWTDTYIVEAKKVASYKGRLSVTEVEKRENVYFDELQSVFTKMTGLDTHL